MDLLFFLWFVVGFFFNNTAVLPLSDCLCMIPAESALCLLYFNVAPLNLLTFSLHLIFSFDGYHISTSVLGWVGVADPPDLKANLSLSDVTDVKRTLKTKVCVFFPHEAHFHCWSSWYIMGQDFCFCSSPLVGPLSNVTSGSTVLTAKWPGRVANNKTHSKK